MDLFGTFGEKHFLHLENGQGKNSLELENQRLKIDFVALLYPSHNFRQLLQPQGGHFLFLNNLPEHPNNVLLHFLSLLPQNNRLIAAILPHNRLPLKHPLRNSAQIPLLIHNSKYIFQLNFTLPNGKSFLINLYLLLQSHLEKIVIVYF